VKSFLKGKNITDLSINRSRQNRDQLQLPTARGAFKGLTFRDLLAMASGTDEEAKLLALIRRVGICSLSFLDKTGRFQALWWRNQEDLNWRPPSLETQKLAIYDEPDTGIDLWTIGPMVQLLKKREG